MTITRKLIIAFWIFIIGMGIWEFYNYNHGLDEQAAIHPEQKQFFFYPPSTKSAGPVSHEHEAGADVEQTAFVIQPNTPADGYFTCLVTLKNMGKVKATSIQINVCPFRGSSNYDEDTGHQEIVVVDDDNPISKIGEFLSFPDLGPGESATRKVSFLNRTDFRPGKNPSPKIMFKTENGAAETSPDVPIIHKPKPPPGTHKGVE